MNFNVMAYLIGRKGHNRESKPGHWKKFKEIYGNFFYAKLFLKEFLCLLLFKFSPKQVHCNETLWHSNAQKSKKKIVPE